MTTTVRALRARRAASVAAALAAVAIAGCDSSILEVKDPDIITQEDLTSASAATTLRAGVTQRFTNATSGQTSDNIFLFGGLLADEWRSGDTFEQRNSTDQRATVEQNSFLAPQFRELMRVRYQAPLAIGAIRQFTPTQTAQVGQMFALRGAAALLLGEHFCNGIPFSTVEGSEVIPGNPLPVDSAFGLAIVDTDSALANLTGTAAATLRYARLARVLKARALVNRGQFAAAAAAIGGAAGVPTNYSYSTYHSTVTSSNQLWSLNTSAKRYVVSDNEGVNGLNFVSANDPRVRTTTAGGPRAFDSATPFFAQTKWGRTDSVIVASGIEARLIEAEAQWRTDMVSAANRVTVTGQLNAIRTASGVTGLAPLLPPATTNAMTDLLFRERAFWMFSTGHRLGDLRRLVRQYGRAAESVYPTGAFHKGGSYSNVYALPVPIQERNNPNFNGCLNTNP